MLNFKRLLIATVLVLVVSGINFAQTGSIKGVVTDKKTKETIIGASVVISGTTNGVSTDLNGNFTISNLKPGTYSLSLSYISYKSKTIENIKVTAENASEIEVEIEEESINIKGITVTASRKTDTEMSMISSIKSSGLVVSGISNQQIQKSQDRDASEVIKRVPGITIIDNRFVVIRGLAERYNVVWLNNASTPSSESDVKAFSFDVIPSAMLDRLMIYKTPAPELPGDFAGGAVMIFTKNDPEKNTINIGYSSSWRSGTTGNDFYMSQGGKTDWLGFDDGTRSLPKSFPNYSDMITLTNSQFASDKDLVQQLGQNLNKIWTAEASKAKPDMRFSLSSTFKKSYNTFSIGNITSISYSNTNTFNDIFRADYQNYDTLKDKRDTSYYFYDKQYTNTVKAGVLHNWVLSFGKKNKIEFRNLINQIGFSRTTLRDGKDFYGGITLRSYELKYRSRFTYSGQLGGSHSFNEEKTKIDWTMGYSFANRKEPDLKRLTTIKSTDDPDDVHYGQYAVQFTTSATPELTGRVNTDMYENIYNATANMEQKLAFGNFKPQLKAGFYLESKNREFSARNIGYRIAKTSMFNWSIPYMSIDSIFMNENINNTNGIKLDEKTNASDSYTAKNQLIAGYIALNIPITALLKIYTGIRIEKNRQQLFSFQTDNPAIPINVDNDTINILPSINFTYDLTEKSLVRLGYGMTLNRPEFREIAPMLFYDFELKAGVRGNVNLKNAYIHNYDIRYECYPSAAESFTIGAFYKKFTNPIETKVIPSGSGLDYSFANAEGAINYGAEIEMRKSLASFSKKSGLLKNLKNFTLVVNTTFIKSIVNFQKEKLEKDRPLQGQSPYIINAGTFYQNDSLGLTISALYNIVGKRIIYVGDPYTGSPDTYEMSRNIIDFTVAKKIGKHWQAKGGVQDILNQKVLFKQSIEFNQDTNNDGIGEGVVKRDQNILFYKPGSYFTLGITYLF